MLLYLLDFKKVFIEGTSKSSTAFLQCKVLNFPVVRADWPSHAQMPR
jgi:hypothetical protein